MEISPIKIFYMIFVALAVGVCVGVINDINRTVRMIMGQSHRGNGVVFIRNTPLPISKRKIKDIECSVRGMILFDVITAFQDLFTFFAASAGVAVLNYYFNNGRARLFTPLAVITGFVLYYFTVGRAVWLASDTVADLIKFVFMTFFEILYYPTRKIAIFFVLFAKNSYKNLNKAIAKKQKKVYNNIKKKRIMDNADEGIVDRSKESARRTR